MFRTGRPAGGCGKLWRGWWGHAEAEALYSGQLPMRSVTSLELRGDISVVALVRPMHVLDMRESAFDACE